MVLSVISKIGMLFFILIVGVITRKCGIIDAASTKKLSALLVNVTQPLLIIDSFQIAYSGSRVQFGLKVLAASAVIHISVALVSYLLFKREKHPEKRRVLEFCMIFGNCAFLGYPVLEAVFATPGAENPGIFYGAFYTLIFNTFLWTYGVSLMRRGKTEEKKGSWRSIFLNVGVISCIVGFVFFLTEFKLPAFIGEGVKMVGNMTFPLSMIIIGSLVATFDFKRVFFQWRVYIFSLLKLIVWPMLVAAIFSLIPVDRDLKLLCIVMAAVPAASNCAIFAELYDSDSPLAAQCVGITTLFSMATIPFNVWMANTVFGI